MEVALVPDRDIIYRTLLPCWRRPYRLLKGATDDTTILGSAILKAIAESLRRGGGAPGLGDAAMVVAAVVSGRVDALAALRELRAVERQERGHIHTRVVVQVGSRMVAEVAHGGVVPPDVPTALAERFCAQLTNFYLFSRVSPALVGTRFASHAEAASYQGRLMGVVGEGLRKEALSLLQRPSGVDIRAPSIPGARRPTAETLHEPVPL